MRDPAKGIESRSEEKASNRESDRDGSTKRVECKRKGEEREAAHTTSFISSFSQGEMKLAGRIEVEAKSDTRWNQSNSLFCFMKQKNVTYKCFDRCKYYNKNNNIQ